MNIVCGVPRSGTSLMMLILKALFGEDRIIGKQFPRLEIEQGKEELDEQFLCRKYLFERNKEHKEKMKDLNPDGFWECLYTVKGVRWRFRDEMLDEITKDKNKYFCKIVSQGLLSSNPHYINKIIYMVRHPKAVAKSQERLRRQIPFRHNNRHVNVSDFFKVHSPEMFIKVSVMASHWIVANPKPICIVHFEDLLKHPKRAIQMICEFLGEGEPEKAYKVVKPKYNRSKPEDVKSDLWDSAQVVYEFLGQGKFKEVLEYVDNPQLPINRQSRTWNCPRSGTKTNEEKCEKCLKNKTYRKGLKKKAEMRKIEWQKEPCFFECGFDLDRDEYISIAESIKNNWWIDE